MSTNYYKPSGRGLTVGCHLKELHRDTSCCNRPSVFTRGSGDVSF